MKRIDYEINVREYLIHLLNKVGTSQKLIADTMENIKPFHVIFSQIGDINGYGYYQADKYELINAETKDKININSVNSADKMYLHMCEDHFSSGKDKEIKEHLIKYTVTIV